MSEVIENYIRHHPGLAEEEALDGFLQEERIRQWIGTDASRKDRIRREFSRVWAAMYESQPAPTTARSGPAGPSARVAPSGPVRQAEPREIHVEVHPTTPRGAPASERQLQLLCTSCGKYDVWLADGAVSCRSCENVFDDMLALIPVKPVGPFAFLFGEGWRGAATAAGIVAGLAAAYFLVRYL